MKKPLFLEISASIKEDGSISLIKKHYEQDGRSPWVGLPTHQEISDLKFIFDKYISENNQCDIDLKNQAIKEERSSVKPKGDAKTPVIGAVYLIKNHRNGYTKIGFTSKEPKFREATLQSQEPDISIFKTYDALYSQEQHLHLIFKKKRIRGEWFNLSAKDFLKIEQYFASKEVMA